MAAARILVVEDERLIARDLSALLKKLGYTVVGTVSTSQEALNLAREQTPDLAILDIVLKGETDGIDTATQLKALGIPVIYLTAYADEETLARARATEPLAYLVKPFDPQDVQITVEICLYTHRLSQERQEELRSQFQALQQEVRQLQRFAHVKDKILNNLLEELSDPFSSLSTVVQLLIESPLASRYQQYLEILKNEFGRESKLIEQVSRLQSLLTPENVSFMDEFSLLSIEKEPAPPPPPPRPAPVETVRYIPETRLLLNKPMNQTDLARRLDVVVSAISYWEAKPAFTEWARSKDPDGVGWEYHPEVKLFYPKP
ncbi:MAG: response regulator [Thermostichales cyanobacterium DRC_bins_46]